MKLCLISFFLLILFSCTENTIVSDDYSDFISDKNLNTDIEFFPAEVYLYSEIENPKLVLKFQTTASYPCINYSIEISTYELDDELIVRFEDVSIGEICFTAVGPASVETILPINTGKVVLINGDKIDIYEVEITNKEVKFETVNNSFTKIKYSKIFRYPENSFEYSCDNNEKNLHLFNAFLDSLNSSTNLKEFDFKGDGRIPYGINSEEEVTKYFIYKNETDFELVGNMFRKFINENSKKEDYIYIRLVNWRNAKYLSWMLYN